MTTYTHMPILRRFGNASHHKRRELLVHAVMLADTCSQTEAEGVVALFEAGVLRELDEELIKLDNPYKRGGKVTGWALAKATIGGVLFMAQMRKSAKYQEAERITEGRRRGVRDWQPFIPKPDDRATLPLLDDEPSLRVMSVEELEADQGKTRIPEPPQDEA